MYSNPLGYLLTWSTYGTHLHYDERGSVDKRHSTFAAPRLRPHAGREGLESELLAGPMYSLSPSARRIVEETVKAHCGVRAWTLLAVNARTEHVHVVVNAPNLQVERVLDQFMSWSTRRFREAGLVDTGQRVWTRHGSTRYLFDQRAVEAAVEYVVNEQ